jgi:hypothetical protein
MPLQPPHRLSIAPWWAEQIFDAIQQLQKGSTQIMSEDAAIEAQVAILTSDATALATAFAALQAEVAGGGSPTDQAMTDLTNAVAAITGTIPPAPAPVTPPAS